MTKLIDCPVCGKEDQPVREDAKVCCSSCRVKQWRINQRKAQYYMMVAGLDNKGSNDES
jgi:predicted nucleic acid-binding Zn ribbon protein